ncbi:MAG: hypothetical protein ABI978_00770 [Chloroflexota bacterium]
MTMPNASHPDDERLAAYAGGHRDAASDRTLAEHVAACDRCRPIVDELTLLRGALAALPDVAPSRPLRLIPPVPAPAAPRGGPLEWLRRLAAPAMAAGAGLVLIGAVGASGIATNLMSATGGRTSTEAVGSDSAGAPRPRGAGQTPVVAPGSVDDGTSFGSRSNSPASATDKAVASPRPSSSARENDYLPEQRSASQQPWLTLLLAGVALFATSTVLRFSLAPRAG